MKTNVKKAIVYIIGAIATALSILFGLTSCEVSRTIATSAESYSKGDTAVVITTKTIETYTGHKREPVIN